MYSAFVRLGKELRGCVPLLGAFASDMVAGPNPMEDGKFLRGIGQVIKARLRPQPNRSRLGCRVAAVSDHCVTEHHLEFERQMLAFWVLRKPFQHSECTGVQVHSPVGGSSSIFVRLRIRPTRVTAGIFKATGAADLSEDLPFGGILAHLMAGRQHISNEYEYVGNSWAV